MPRVRGGDREHQAAMARTAREGLPMPEVRGSGREELPHVQGVAAVWAQEGQEEVLHVQGQEG